MKLTKQLLLLLTSLAASPLVTAEEDYVSNALIVARLNYKACVLDVLVKDKESRDCMVLEKQADAHIQVMTEVSTPVQQHLLEVYLREVKKYSYIFKD